MNSAQIKKLRANGRNPDYCRQVSPQELDTMILSLHDRSSGQYDEIVDLLATISNVLLINRDLHTNYFTKTHSNSLLKFLDNLINTRIALGQRPDHNYDFLSLIPIYRLIFLILYDGLNNVNDALVHNICTLLITGFKFCDGLFTQFKNNEYYKMTFIEILKSLYTLNHKYKYGGELIKHQHLSYNVILTINEMFEFKPNPHSLTRTGTLLLKSLLNFLLGLFTINDSNETIDVLISNNKIYEVFLQNTIGLLKFQLANYFHDDLGDSNYTTVDSSAVSSITTHTTTNNSINTTTPVVPEFELSDLNNLLVVINFIHHQVIAEFTLACQNNNTQQKMNQDRFLGLHNVLKRGILPDTGENSNYIYNKLIGLINSANKSVLPSSESLFSGSTNIGIESDINQLSYSKNIVLQFFYNLSWQPHNDKVEQMTRFLDLVGYLNAETFISNNDLLLSPQINLDKYLYPNTDYLDPASVEELNNAGKDSDGSSITHESAIGSMFNHPQFSRQNSYASGQSNQPSIDDLTEAEKEIEAEKLFTIFDRMEKTGVFQNFKNPVREWQQSGKFEDLPNHDGDRD